MMPNNPAARFDLCGWAGQKVAEEAWNKIGDRFASFFIAGKTVAQQTRKTKWWKVFKEVTGKVPNLQPQPTGNCVAAGARDVVEGIQAIEIKQGERQKFEEIYDPFHYAVGREEIGKGQLRGSAGSVGSWQAEGIRLRGVLLKALKEKALPGYTKAEVDAWGDGRTIKGVGSYKDFYAYAAEHVVKSTARLSSVKEVIQSIDNGYLCTIAADFAYTMKPVGGPKGFHKRSREPCPHQQSVWDFDLDTGSLLIKNQWGDVHGELEDSDGEPIPPGFRRVTMEDFEAHVRAGEVFAYSKFDGFPEQLFDYGGLG
jgi:hypothetical protein